ncbi:hypothetical protein D1864_09830 [Oceanobacillus picturae]|nr:hypothetical protein D1864_09830 [Oceanobacillus picturae]
MIKQKPDDFRIVFNKIRIRPELFITLWIQGTLLNEGKYLDSSGNSTSPKTPEEAFFASEEAEAVPTESVVFSVTIYMQYHRFFH